MAGYNCLLFAVTYDLTVHLAFFLEVTVNDRKCVIFFLCGGDIARPQTISLERNIYKIIDEKATMLLSGLSSPAWLMYILSRVAYVYPLQSGLCIQSDLCIYSL